MINIVFIANKRFLNLATETAKLYRKLNLDICLLYGPDVNRDDIDPNVFTDAVLVNMEGIGLAESDRIPNIAYAKLLIPQLFRYKYDYSIYFDSDTFPKNLSSLTTDFISRVKSIECIGMVAHSGIPRKVAAYDYSKYYNSGVIAFNNNHSMHLDIVKLSKIYAGYSKKIVFEDQCFINLYYNNFIADLPCYLNATTDHYYFNGDFKVFAQDCEYSAIIHFTGLFGKPDQLFYIHPEKHLSSHIKSNLKSSTSQADSFLKCIIRYALYRLGIYRPFI